MRRRVASSVSVVAGVLFATAAFASPVTTAPSAIAVNGNVKLVYIGASAGDHSALSEIGGASNIFCNNPVGSCGATAPGTIADLGTQNGSIAFSLTDTTVTNVFTTDSLAADGFYHAKVTTDYADLGIFAEPAAAASAIDSLLTASSTIYYVSFEDRLNGDYDYNDFAFAVIDPPPAAAVPEPLTLSLMGAGLAGLGVMRRRRRR